MPKLLLLMLLFVFSSNIYAQTGADSSIAVLLNNRQFSEALQQLTPLQDKRISDPVYYHLLGKAYLGSNNLSIADSCFNRSISLEANPTWVTAWSQYNLATIALARKDTALARQRLLTVIRLRQTQNSVYSAQRLLDKIAAHPASIDFRNSFITISSPHFDFHFQDTAGRNEEIAYYISSHEAAYDTINAFFRAIIPKKIQFYVWFDRDYYIACNKCPPGFSRPIEYTAYVTADQTVGHELTHILSCWAGGIPTGHESPFMDEGIAVHFNGSNRHNMPDAKAFILAHTGFTTVKDLWQSPEQLSGSLYPVAGAFIDYLFTQCTTEQLRSIFHDQSYTHFTDVVGKKTAAAIIRHFDEQVLSKN